MLEACCDVFYLHGGKQVRMRMVEDCNHPAEAVVGGRCSADRIVLRMVEQGALLTKPLFRMCLFSFLVICVVRDRID